MPFGSVKLNDGYEIPAIAFGTGSSNKGRPVVDFVEQAFEHGFTHIDTAQSYGNEEEVGVALREEGLKRDEVFVTTKYSEPDTTAQQALDASLQKLGLKQVDLWLIHNPRWMGDRIEANWRVFEAARDAGLTRSIGVSNFSLDQLQALVKVARIPPVVNQIRLSPYNWAENASLVAYTAKQNIVIEAYSSLAPITRQPGGPLDPVLARIGTRIGATPAQVIFAWLKSKNVVIVTTTTKGERLDEYLATADLPPLTDEDIADIEEAGAKGARRRLDAKTLGRRFLAVCACTMLFAGLHWIRVAA